jgi:PKHD-type hydroxylase
MPLNFTSNADEPHIIADTLAYYTEILPEKLIDLMVEELKEMEQFKVPFIAGGMGDNPDDPGFDKKIRNSKLYWWFEDHWACSIISHYIGVANRQRWEYDLNLLQSVQVSVYTEGGHYDWHSDYGASKNGNFTRKLSASVLVSDPSEYEGGDLEMIDYHGNIITTPKQMGSIIVFDSRIPHRVTPVTKGRRVSLVTWMYGPKLR